MVNVLSLALFYSEQWTDVHSDVLEIPILYNKTTLWKQDSGGGGKSHTISSTRPPLNSSLSLILLQNWQRVLQTNGKAPICMSKPFVMWKGNYVWWWYKYFIHPFHGQAKQSLMWEHGQAIVTLIWRPHLTQTLSYFNLSNMRSPCEQPLNCKLYLRLRLVMIKLSLPPSNSFLIYIIKT